jgi:small-conductance mechanosensitive channel
MFGVKVEDGQFLCYNHLEPLPEGQKYSKMNRPVLKQATNGLAWTSPSKRKGPPQRYEPLQPKKRKISKRQLECKVRNLENEIEEREKEMSKKMNEEVLEKRFEVEERQKRITDLIKELERKTEEMEKVEDEVKRLKEKAMMAPIDSIIASLTESPEFLAWFGVPNFEDFYAEVARHLTPYGDSNMRYQLERALIQLRNGFNMRVGVALLQPNNSRYTFNRRFQHTLEDLYTWAVPQIHLLKASEWKKSNTPRLEELYPGFLFYFLDGTGI